MVFIYLLKAKLKQCGVSNGLVARPVGYSGSTVGSSRWNSGKVPKTKVMVDTITTPSEVKAMTWKKAHQFGSSTWMCALLPELQRHRSTIVFVALRTADAILNCTFVKNTLVLVFTKIFWGAGPSWPQTTDPPEFDVTCAAFDVSGYSMRFQKYVRVLPTKVSPKFSSSRRCASFSLASFSP